MISPNDYLDDYIVTRRVRSLRDAISRKEIERLPRVSVIEITKIGWPQSVGGSIKLGFMMVKLAREHGWRYVAQTSGAGVKKIGGLEKLDDDPAKSLGDDFAGLMRRRILMLKNWDGFAMRFRGGMGLLLMGSNTSTGAAFGCFLL